MPDTSPSSPKGETVEQVARHKKTEFILRRCGELARLEVPEAAIAPIRDYAHSLQENPKP